MRTTIRLDDALLEEARRYAIDRGETLTSIFEEALREKLARRHQKSRRRRVPLPTFRGRGVRSGIDVHDSPVLLDAMEGSRRAGT